MESKEKKFRLRSESISFDAGHRKILGYNINQYDKAVIRGKGFFHDLENARKQASKIKGHTIRDLDNMLVRFEKKARDNGSEVLWASDSNDALQILRQIIIREKISLVVKMKSMISEELEINQFLDKLKVEYFETDLGEFIVQAAGEKPYHILTPAMHKSRHDVAKLFNEKFGMEPDSTPEEVTAFVRDYLRERFVKADMGITGANFLIAETGSVALTENEGNGMMTFSWPKVLVVIAGIEKMIPELTDLGLFWPLLGVLGTGQNISAYNTVLSGPRKGTEADGPDRMVIILLDGGRTRLTEGSELRQALNCIRCGACLSACPIYKNIGGHTYQTTYTGPIGSIISMYLDGSTDAGFLNFASSLCGKCSEVCPVGIPLHKLLLLNRARIVETSDNQRIERFFFGYFKRMMMRRKTLERVNSKWKNKALKTFGQKVWGPRRIPLTFARESFSKMWKNRFH